MGKGWLIYNKEDLKKNTVFANLLQKHGYTQGLDIKILTRESLSMGSEKGNLFMHTEEEQGLPDFVINRTRNPLLARQVQLLGIPVFNSYEVTELCNDKLKTHQFINSLGIHSVPTIFFDTLYDTPEQVSLAYPLVVKKIDGHGGMDVGSVEDIKAFKDVIKKFSSRYLVVQEMCDNPGVDIRVFVVGRTIVGAIKRESKVDFRSNYSLGGETSVYTVDETLQGLVDKIGYHIKCDCVGMDFMVNQAGDYIFNEIEDVVGSRSLYQHTNTDIADLYIQHIATQLG